MDLRQHFRELHESPFIIPNPWDIGSARLLASLGFSALATTSSGHAASLGRHDGAVTREEAISHARALVGATSLPVSADLERTSQIRSRGCRPTRKRVQTSSTPRGSRASTRSAASRLRSTAP